MSKPRTILLLASLALLTSALAITTDILSPRNRNPASPTTTATSSPHSLPQNNPVH